MIGKLRDKLTYANVVGTIALFAALSGSAYAAFRVPPNSVGSRQLKAKSVTGGKIANATISGGKIEAETITGANIKMSALGTVPAAANAANAANANAVGGHAASCLEHTTLIRGLCFDDHSNPPAKASKQPPKPVRPRAAGCRPRWSSTPPRASSTSDENTSVAQHQFTDALYGEVSSGNLEKTVVVDGVGPPESYEANGESAYYCVYPLVR